MKTAVHGIRKRRESWTRSDAEQQMCMKTKDCLEYLEQEENVDRHGPFADRFKEMLEGLEWDWSASAFRDGSVYQVHCRLSQLLLDYALSVKRPRFVCLQTSRKLLANFKKQEAAGMRSLFTRDDTYKTNYQGLPIEVPSTSVAFPPRTNTHEGRTGGQHNRRQVFFPLSQTQEHRPSGTTSRTSPASPRRIRRESCSS